MVTEMQKSRTGHQDKNGSTVGGRWQQRQSDSPMVCIAVLGGFLAKVSEKVMAPKFAHDSPLATIHLSVGQTSSELECHSRCVCRLSCPDCSLNRLRVTLFARQVVGSSPCASVPGRKACPRARKPGRSGFTMARVRV